MSVGAGDRALHPTVTVATVTAPARGAERDKTALICGLLAYLGGGAGAIYLPLGVLGVPLALILGAVAIRRGSRLRRWPPVGAAVLGLLFSMLWFGLMAIESGAFPELFRCAAIEAPC